MQAHAQGIVILEAGSPTGCVRYLKVLRASVGLDVAALRTVSEWAFTRRS